MNTRLPGASPIALLLFAVLLLVPADAVVAQQSRSADSVKATSRERRSERGRQASREAQTQRTGEAQTQRTREAQTQRTRGASGARAARPNNTARAPSSARTPSPSRSAAGDSDRGGTSEGGRTSRGTRGGSDGRSARERTAPRRGSDDDGQRGNRPDDRGNRSDDRGNHSDDRWDHSDDRWDRSDDRWDRSDNRGGRDYDRRDHKRHRRGSGAIIVNPPPKTKTWARPRVHVNISWPWLHRHERRWSPRYRYRQVVYVDAGWGRSRRESRLDLRTFYRHRVLEASSRRAVVDIQIDRIEIYEDGFFLGEVRSIPPELAGMRAVVDRRYGVDFDRDVFLLGDPYAGFEIISTRHYDGFVLDRYHTSHGITVGVLDFRRERVMPVRRSRFFDPHDFSGFVPLNLLPEDAGWLIDYGYDSYSGHYWSDDDRYYYGFSDVHDYARRSDDRAQYSQTNPNGTTARRDSVSSRLTPKRQALERSADRTFEMDNGATIRLKRESSIERVD